MIIEYLLLGLGMLLLLLIYYVYSKDAQQARQIRSIASAVEELHRQLYTTEKKINRRIADIASSEPSVDNEDIHRELEEGMQRIAVPVSQSLQEIQRGFAAYKADIDKRLGLLEGGMRNFSMPSSVGGMDDDKIIALFKQGIDIDTIAKELRLSKPEVEFVLKINKIR